MRQIITAAALALGLIALWAALLPLTAQPAPAQTVAGSQAMAKALFLCHGPHGIDQKCVAALAQALVLDPAPNQAVTRVSSRACHVDRQNLASLASRD